MTPKTRVCRHCGKRRPVELFFKNTREGSSHRPECKLCTKLRRQQKESP